MQAEERMMLGRRRRLGEGGEGCGRVMFELVAASKITAPGVV